MVHFMHLDLLSARMADHQPNLLILEIEFTHPSQQDGHGPWHGDDARDFAEAILRNLPREKLVALLKEQNINGLKIQKGSGVQVWDLNKLHKDNFCPLHKMEIRISCVPEPDTHVSLANQLMGSVSWRATKAAIACPGKYMYDNGFIFKD